MKLLKYFDSFLENTVNLNQARMELLDTRTTAITNFLKMDEVFASILTTTYPQGSYAQRTIIRPRNNGTFDADLLLHLDPIPKWDACEYVGKLYTALGRSPIYSEMRHRRTRSVYIDYADEFHVDLVPYVEDNDRGYITNRKTDSFELTDPKGFTGWLKDQNRITNGHLIKVIRLLKYVRDTTWGLNVKSVILTTLVGERVSGTAPVVDPGCYADVPTTLRKVVGDLDDYLQQNYWMPGIIDPGGTGDQFDQRWDQEGYASFREKINVLRSKIDEATAASDVAGSVAAWQGIFGTTFKAPPAPNSTAGRGALVVVGGRTLPVTERFLDRDFGIPFVQSRHKLRMVGRVTAKRGFRHGPLATLGHSVERGRDLVFEVAACDVPRPYDIYWKVRNNGHAAQEAGGLRGEIRKGGASRSEKTSYRGSHWVECYIVRGGECVARARQTVDIS